MGVGSSKNECDEHSRIIESQLCDDVMGVEMDAMEAILDGSSLDLSTSTVSKVLSTDADLSPNPVSLKSQCIVESFAHVCDFTKFCDENQVPTFDYERFSTSTASDLKKCLAILIESYYENPKFLRDYKVILYEIFKFTRYTPSATKKFAQAFESNFQKALSKMSDDEWENWEKVDMFGRFLCELLGVYHADNFVVSKHLDKWMKKLIALAVDGNDRALNSFRDIAKFLEGNTQPLKEMNINCEVILKILEMDESKERKAELIERSYDNERIAFFTGQEPIDEDEYLKEVSTSQKCLLFAQLLESTEQSRFNYDLNNFYDMTKIELEFLSRKIIKTSIEAPRRIKFIGSMLIYYQQCLTKMRSFVKLVTEQMEAEIDELKNENLTKLRVYLFNKLIADLYVCDKSIISTMMLTNWLNTVYSSNTSAENKFSLIKGTLSICGFKYIQDDQVNCENVKKIYEELRPINSLSFQELIDSSTNELKSYQSGPLAPKINDFDNFLELLKSDRDVTLNCEWIYKSMISKDAKNFVNKALEPPQSTNRFAQFLKDLFILSFKLGELIKRLKGNLLKNIPDLTVTNPEEVMNLGLLIAELRNLIITDNVPQTKWLEKIKTFDQEALYPVQLVVLKRMLLNLQLHDDKVFMEHVKYIQHLKDQQSRPELDEILAILVPKVMDSGVKSFLLSIKHGRKAQVPIELFVQDDVLFDLMDLAKCFYAQATSNRFQMVKICKFLPDIVQTLRGGQFQECLVDVCIKSVKSMTFSDIEQSLAELQFMTMMFKNQFIKEHDIIEEILKLRECGNLECLKFFMSRLQNDVGIARLESSAKFSYQLRNLVQTTALTIRRENACERNQNQQQPRRNDNIQAQQHGSRRNFQSWRDIPGTSKNKGTNQANKSKGGNQAPGKSNKNQQGAVKSGIGSQGTKNLNVKNEAAVKSSISNQEESKSNTRNQVAPKSAIGDKVIGKLDSRDQLAVNSSTSNQVAVKSKFNVQLPAKSNQTVANSSNQVATKPSSSDHSDLKSNSNAQGIASGSSSGQLSANSHPGPSSSSPCDQVALKSSQTNQAVINSDPSSQALLKSDQSSQALTKSTTTDQVASKPGIKLPTSFNFVDKQEIDQITNVILPQITASSIIFKLFSINLHESNDPCSKEITGLLARKLQKDHKQLLQQVRNELNEYCFEFHKRPIFENITERRLFMLSVTAVTPFVGILFFYKILNNFLNFIKNGNQNGITMVAELVEHGKGILVEESQERTKFKKNAVEILTKAFGWKSSVSKREMITVTLSYLKELKDHKIIRLNEPAMKDDEMVLLKNDASGSCQVDDKSRASSQGSVRSSGTNQSLQKWNVTGQTDKNTKAPIQGCEMSSGISQSLQKSSVPGQLDQKSRASSQVSLKSSISIQNSQKSVGISQSSRTTSPSPQSGRTLPENVENKINSALKTLSITNFREIGKELAPLVPRNEARKPILFKLLQKGISDEKFSAPASRLIEFLFRSNNWKQAKINLSVMIHCEFCSKLDNSKTTKSELLNLVKFLTHFQENLKESFRFQLWKEVLQYVEDGHPFALNVLVLMMYGKVEMLGKTSERNNCVNFFLKVMKSKLDTVTEKDIKEKLQKIIENLRKIQDMMNQKGSQKAQKNSQNPQKVHNISQKNVKDQNVNKKGTDQSRNVTKTPFYQNPRKVHNANTNSSATSNSSCSSLKKSQKNPEPVASSQVPIDPITFIKGFANSANYKESLKGIGTNTVSNQKVVDSGKIGQIAKGSITTTASSLGSDLKESSNDSGPVLSKTIASGSSSPKYVPFGTAPTHKMSTEPIPLKLTASTSVPMSSTTLSSVTSTKGTFGHISSSSPSFGPVPSSSLAFGPVQLNSTPFGPIPPNSASLSHFASASAPFGQFPSTSTAFGPVSLNSTSFGPFQTGSASFGQIHRATTDYGPVPSSRTAFSPIPPSSIPFGQLPLASTVFGPVPSNSTGFGPISTNSTAFGPVPSVPTPSNRVPLKTLHFGAVPSNSIPFGSGPSTSNASVPQNPQSDENKLLKSLTKELSELVLDPSEPESATSMRIHPDDRVRPLILTSSYFLFNQTMRTEDKFKEVMALMIKNMGDLGDGTFRMKEQVALTIVRISYMNIQEHAMVYQNMVKIFFDIYNFNLQHKHLQKVLVKFLKGLKIFGSSTENFGLAESDGTLPDKIDRFTKSVYRMVKSFYIAAGDNVPQKASQKIVYGFFFEFQPALEKFLIQFPSHFPENLAASSLIADLYLHGVSNSTFLVKSLDVLIDSGKNYFFIAQIITKVGALLEIQESENFERIFKKFVEASEVKGTETWKELTELRKNRWSTVQNFSPVFLQFHEDSAKFFGFIENLWMNFMDIPHKVSMFAEVVEELWELLDETFQFLITNFMDQRRATFEKIPAEKYTDMVRERLKGSILLTYELSEMGIVGKEKFKAWLTQEIIEKLGSEGKMDIRKQIYWEDLPELKD